MEELENLLVFKQKEIIIKMYVVQLDTWFEIKVPLVSTIKKACAYLKRCLSDEQKAHYDFYQCLIYEPFYQIFINPNETFEQINAFNYLILYIY